MSHLGKYAEKVYASSRSGTGGATIVCNLPYKYGNGGVREFGTAGRVDMLAGGAAAGKLLQEWICGFDGNCSNCVLAQLAEKEEK